MNTGHHSLCSNNRWPDEVRQAFDRFPQQGDSDGSHVVTTPWAPRVDIRENDKRFVILADIPGVDLAQIEVSLDKGILAIKCERDGSILEDKCTRAQLCCRSSQ